jgi:hypothetical protein
MNQLCGALELTLALGDWAVARDIELHLPRLQKALQGGPHLELRTGLPRALQTTRRPDPLVDGTFIIGYLEMGRGMGIRWPRLRFC